VPTCVADRLGTSPAYVRVQVHFGSELDSTGLPFERCTQRCGRKLLAAGFRQERSLSLTFWNRADIGVRLPADPRLELPTIWPVFRCLFDSVRCPVLVRAIAADHAWRLLVDRDGTTQVVVTYIKQSGSFGPWSEKRYSQRAIFPGLQIESRAGRGNQPGRDTHGSHDLRIGAGRGIVGNPVSGQTSLMPIGGLNLSFAAPPLTLAKVPRHSGLNRGKRTGPVSAARQL